MGELVSGGVWAFNSLLYDALDVLDKEEHGGGAMVSSVLAIRNAFFNPEKSASAPTTGDTTATIAMEMNVAVPTVRRRGYPPR